ncbi:MAG TPA: site-specific integrase [Candidatus Angelobacter sp.]
MKNPRGIFEKIPGSGEWWIRYADANSKMRREKVGNKGAAIKLYRKRKTQVLEGKKLPETLRAKAVTFSVLAADTLEYSKVHKRSWEDDTIRMKPLLATFGDRAADSITPQDIQRFLEKHTKTPATFNRYRALLCLTYRLAIENGKVTSNPARLVRQKRENNAVERYLLSDEETKLRAVVQERYPHHLPELDFALNTGMRMSEQYGLNWSDINFELRQAVVHKSKHGGSRHVYLNDAALAALLTVRSQSNGKPAVFLNRFGERLLRPREWFEPCVKEAGLKNFTWHCLRHTFASRLTMKGVGIRAVQEAMGHKTLSMTCRYAHLAPQHQLAAVQVLCDNGSSQNAPTDTKTSTSISQTIESLSGRIQ